MYKIDTITGHAILNDIYWLRMVRDYNILYNLFFSKQQSYENDVYQMGGCAQRPFVLLV